MPPKSWESGYLDATIEYLARFTFYASQAQKETYRADLCNAIATALPNEPTLAYLYHGPYRNSVKVKTNMCRSDSIGMLAAAAAVGNERAVLFLIDKVRSISTSSELLGAPLLAACANGEMQVAGILFERIHRTDDMALHHFWYTIKRLMEKKRRAMLATLLDWYFTLPA